MIPWRSATVGCSFDIIDEGPGHRGGTPMGKDQLRRWTKQAHHPLEATFACHYLYLYNMTCLHQSTKRQKIYKEV